MKEQPETAHAEPEKPHKQKSRQERFIGALDSWQKTVLAITALVLALGSLTAAGIKVSQTVWPGASPGDNYFTHSTVAPSLAGSEQSTAVTASGTEIDRNSSISLPDTYSLDYTSATGSQVLFTNWGSLGELDAGPNVNLAVLDPPAPAANAAYKACKNDGNFTTQITLDSLAPGSTLCGFTPNNQVLWIRFLPTDANSQSSALRVAVITWQGPNG